MTESKNTPESEAASTTPPSDAPTDAGSAAPVNPEGSGSSPDAASPPAGEAPADSGAGAPTAPPESTGAGATPPSTPAADADATLISPPPADPEATLEAPVAPPAPDAAATPSTDAPLGTTDPAAPATGAEAAPAEPTGDVATGAATTDAPPVDASAGAGAAAADGTAMPATDAPAADAAATETPRTPTLPADAAGGALRSDRINLVASSGQAMSVGVRTSLGKHIVRQFGEESNVWDTEQFVLERTPEGAWQIVPREGTTNETLLNGEAITAPRPLHDGDVIAVGRAEKGIVKLPLTARAG